MTDVELQSGPLKGVLIQVTGLYQKAHWWNRRFPVYLKPEMLTEEFIATVIDIAARMRAQYKDPDAPVTMQITPAMLEAVRK